jgi:hypothetical protein
MHKACRNSVRSPAILRPFVIFLSPAGNYRDSTLLDQRSLASFQILSRPEAGSIVPTRREKATRQSASCRRQRSHGRRDITALHFPELNATRHTQTVVGCPVCSSGFLSRALPLLCCHLYAGRGGSWCKSRTKIKLFPWQAVEAYKIVRCWGSHIV